jgi:hypothetical protein
VTRAFVCVLVAACADQPEAWIGDRPVSIDVVVSGDYVSVHAPVAGSTSSTFSPLGACGDSTDAVLARDSCLEHIVVDGEIATWEHGSSMSIQRANPRELVIEGCLRRVSIALSAREVPTPSMLTHARDASGITVTWATDVPAASALVMVSTGYVGRHCHVAGTSSHTLSFDEDYQVTSTAVFTFADPDVIDSPLGRIHVWYGAVVGSDEQY